MAQYQAGKIQHEKRRSADESLQRKRKEIESDHIEKQVTNVSMHEAAKDHRRILTLTNEKVRSEQTAVDQPRHLEQAQQAHSDRQRHQRGRGKVLVVKQ